MTGGARVVLAAEAAAGLMCCGVVLLAGDNACIALSSLRSIALRITEHVCVKHSCSGDSTCAGTALSATKWSGGDARFGFGGSSRRLFPRTWSRRLARAAR